MRVPKKVKIGAHVWRVLRPNKILGDKGDKAKGIETLGLCTVPAKKIRVRARLPESIAAETLLHELLHAILDPLGLEIEQEENIVGVLSAGLLQVIRDNNLRFDLDT